MNRVLSVISILFVAGCASVLVTEKPDMPNSVEVKARSTQELWMEFPDTIDFELPQDPSSLREKILAGISLWRSCQFGEAAYFFERAAEELEDGELREACLMAAAVCYLVAGEREEFVEVVRRMNFDGREERILKEIAEEIGRK
ncbi:MAG: hypothetical protein DRN28_07190 [Thermoplasmata archaeon]|nr:MAG: hypothetical protein DRN28_07190 [Thermoplasmata archaeon]